MKEKTFPQKQEMVSKKHPKQFVLKIADLLNEAGRSDEIVFDHKFSEQLPHVSDDGVSGSLSVQSLDQYSLLGTLHDISATMRETCESCGAHFTREIEIPSYVSRFVFEKDISEDEKVSSEDPLLYIDTKDETIDIEDMIVQAILLNDPFVKRCPACTKRLDDLDNNEEDLGEFVSKGNIMFS